MELMVVQLVMQIQSTAILAILVARIINILLMVSLFAAHVFLIVTFVKPMACVLLAQLVFQKYLEAAFHVWYQIVSAVMPQMIVLSVIKAVINLLEILIQAAVPIYVLYVMLQTVILVLYQLLLMYVQHVVLVINSMVELVMVVVLVNALNVLHVLFLVDLALDAVQLYICIQVHVIANAHLALTKM